MTAPSIQSDPVALPPSPKDERLSFGHTTPTLQAFARAHEVAVRASLVQEAVASVSRSSDEDGLVQWADKRMPVGTLLYSGPPLAPSSYPLPDSLYPGSKDWMAGDYAARVEWLHTMYESVKQDRDQLLCAPAMPTNPEPSESQVEKALAEYDLSLRSNPLNTEQGRSNPKWVDGMRRAAMRDALCAALATVANPAELGMRPPLDTGTKP